MINDMDKLRQWGYEKTCFIGEGAFSKVYRVKECVTGHTYACKVSEKWEMLKRESMILQQVSHPLFPTFRDFRQQEGSAYLFMEYIPGVSLKTLIARRGALSERRAIEVAVEVASGLEYLHELSSPILFRDLKPENIMIKENGGVKVLDFGSAGMLDAGKHVITGTPGFAAPEQWKAGEMVGFYSDVYALGKVMYYMLTARNPQMTGDGTETGKNSPRKLHRGVMQLLEDCLRAEAAERIPDMRCFLRRLEPYYSGRRGEILLLELSAYLQTKSRAEYIFQKNILK